MVIMLLNEHDVKLHLIMSLKQLAAKLDIIESYYKKLEMEKTKSIMQRNNRIANIGANLDSLFSKKPRKPRTKQNYYHTTAEVNPFNVGTNEILGTRSCRLKSRINYTFEEFDRTINEAIIDENGEGMICVNTVMWYFEFINAVNNFSKRLKSTILRIKGGQAPEGMAASEMIQTTLIDHLLRLNSE
jgi:hypothetical protein